MLKITGVQKTFNPGTINEKKALCGIDLTLNEGDFVTVIGGNGATMLNMIAGVYPVDCGSIVIDGKDVTKLPEYKRAKFIGRVFQDPMTGTAADMQIAENLAIAARRGKGRTLRSGVSKKEKVQYAEMLKELDLGLDTRLTSKVGLLSGGQRQKHIPLNAEHRIKRRKALYGAVIAAKLPKRVNYNDHQHECGGDFIDNGLILRLFCSSFVLCHHSVLSFDSKFLYTV